MPSFLANATPIASAESDPLKPVTPKIPGRPPPDWMMAF